MRANGLSAVRDRTGRVADLFHRRATGAAASASTAAVLPVEGEPLIVCPFFEEPSVRETLAVPATVRVWQEDESPLKLIAGWLARTQARRAARSGSRRPRASSCPTACRALLPGVRVVSANPVVRGCRMIKTPAEIALMQLATDVTIAAYRWTWPRVERGMTGGGHRRADERRDRASSAAAPEFALALIGEAAAYPHGTRKRAPGRPTARSC